MRADYIIVSPVKDEEAWIERTILAVVRQTVRPLRWLIVDDGSCDGTPEILKRYSKEHEWITVLTVGRDGGRQLGTAEIAAFERGYRSIQRLPHGFIVKLDCDLDFPPNYFEQLLERFQLDRELGIASGLYVEKSGCQWARAALPFYHASGASKMIRVECFDQIGGFVLRPGWDTVDEIKARALGWKTRHFPELLFCHLRPEGSASGYWKTARLWGHVDYVTGVSVSFFLMKTLHRMIARKPLFVTGLAMFTGFLWALLTRAPKLVSAEEARMYRRLLAGRIAGGFGRLGN